MPIIGRTATKVELTSSQTITATLPPDWVVGDLVVADFGLSSLTGLAVTSGWTQLFTPFSGGGTAILAAYYRRMQAGDSAGPTASVTAVADRCTALAQSYGGVDPTTPIDVVAVIKNNAGATPATSVVVGPITPVTNGARLISGSVADGNASNTTITEPAGMTLVAKQTNTTGQIGRGCAFADEVIVTAGSAVSRTWTQTTTTITMSAWICALRPAPPVVTKAQPRASNRARFRAANW